MKKQDLSMLLTGLLFLSTAMIFTACSPQETTQKTAPQKKAATKTAISWPCLNPPSMTAAVPGDTVLSDQGSFDCFAWQEFIAVNWPTDPQESFGQVGSYSPVVFETYMSTQEFLKPDGSRPPSWNERSFAHYDKKHDIRKMLGTSKISLDFDPDQDLAEAFPADANRAWLADKNGSLVWYEVLVNKDEFEYFYEHKFYDSMEQYKAASEGRHIDLPKGDLDADHVGAMEFKAAWLTVTDPNADRWKRYKMTKAQICSSDGVCSTQNFALVGLHIIHKTAAQPSWVWSTFEHMDNAPDAQAVKEGKAKGEYTFYNPDCKEKAIPPECVNGYLGEKTSCTPNTSPAYALSLVNGEPAGKCKPYPIQVTREFPLANTDENPVVAINNAAHQLIRQDNDTSVYQYYNLVNVLWNDSPVDENKGKKPPLNSLSDTAFRPDSSAFPVANTVLETYIQGTTCVGCHSNATIKSPANGKHFASDYSFIFSLAGSSKK